MYMYIYLYMYIYIHIHLHIYIYIYTVYTYTNMYYIVYLIQANTIAAVNALTATAFCQSTSDVVAVDSCFALMAWTGLRRVGWCYTIHNRMDTGYRMDLVSTNCQHEY